jgi:glutamate-1-semialdehyde aminotransferase
MEGLRELATRYGALLMIDETHTFSAGWGGATAAWNLEPDIFVIGKSIGGGIPCGAYGITNEVAAAITSTRMPGTPTSSTWAGWAAPSPATRCRPRRCGPRSVRC